MLKIMKLLLMILMINLVGSSKYYLERCCSKDSKEQIDLSCDINHSIHLNLIEIFYNSNRTCLSSSSSSMCCQRRSSCSRRLTKYSRSKCDEQNSCSIEITCLKIHQKCASENAFYGEYLTIDYSCLPNNNRTMPFLIQLLTIDDQPLEQSSFLSSSLFFILVLLICIFFILSMYCFAHWIGKRFCRQNQSRLKSKKIFIQSYQYEKEYVQGNYSSPSTRIYPMKTYPWKEYFSPRPYINVYQDPRTGQITSRTFFTYY